ncbi:MAG: hypothetical protein IMW99_02355 [Firmicutes bacterium]|nr:hypothetical protein [Bacillota bacterium]
MEEERRQILEMLKDGKVSVEEAARLLDTLEPPAAERPAAQSNARAHFLRIRVDDGENSRVNVNIPLSLARMAFKFIPKGVMKNLEEQNLDLDDILKAIQEGAEGKIVDVDAEGAKVEIYVE